MGWVARCLLIVAVLAGPVRAGEPLGLAQERPDEVLVKARATYKKALGLVQAGKNEAALTAFEAVLEPLANEPNSSDLLYNLVQVGRALKRWDKVLLYAQAFVAKDGEGSDARAMGSLIALAKARLGQEVAPIELTITAPAEADVFVDKTPFGRAERRVLWVVPGVHRVRVVQAGFAPYDQDATVAAGATGATLVVALVKAVLLGKLEVKGTPAEGVQVFVDDELEGVTPLPALTLAAKRCLVRFEKPGYGSWARYLVIEANATVVVSPLLEKVSGPTTH